MSKNEDENRFNRVASDFYSNDWIMAEVLKNIKSHKDRLNIELSSKRLLSLSRDTPCYVSKSLRIYLTFYEEQNGRNCKIVVEKKKGLYYKEIKELKFKRSRSQIGQTLGMIGQRYYNFITRITIHESIDGELLRIINRYFKRTKELYCHGFTSDAIEFLHSNDHMLGKRITKLGLYDFKLPANAGNDVLMPFRSLNKMSCKIYQGWPLNLLCDNLEKIHKLDVISIRHSCCFHKRGKSEECPDFTKVSEYCRSLKFSDQNILSQNVQKYIFQVQNLTHLEVWLWSLSESEIVSFFSALHMDQLESVSLNRLFFNDNILSAIRSSHSRNSKLYDLKIDGWYTSNITKQLLLSICPSSLKKLYIKQCTIETDDLYLLYQNCPNLIDLHCDPGIEFTSARSQNPHDFRERFAARGIDLSSALLRLKQLQNFKTKLRMEPEFLSMLCNELPGIVKAQFPIHKIRKDKAFELLKMFYNKVKITKNPYILDFEDSDIEREIEERMNALPRFPSHFPFSSWELCETWHVVVENPVHHRPTKPVDFSSSLFSSQFCYCDRISSLF